MRSWRGVKLVVWLKQRRNLCSNTSGTKFPFPSFHCPKLHSMKKGLCHNE